MTGIIIIIIIIFLIVFIILKGVPLRKVTWLDLNSMTLLKVKHQKLSICLSSQGSSSDVIRILNVQLVTFIALCQCHIVFSQRWISESNVMLNGSRIILPHGSFLWLCACCHILAKAVELPLWRFTSRSSLDKPVLAQPDSMQVRSFL